MERQLKFDTTLHDAGEALRSKQKPRMPDELKLTLLAIFIIAGGIASNAASAITRDDTKSTQIDTATRSPSPKTKQPKPQKKPKKSKKNNKDKNIVPETAVTV